MAAVADYSDDDTPSPDSTSAQAGVPGSKWTSAVVAVNARTQALHNSTTAATDAIEHEAAGGQTAGTARNPTSAWASAVAAVNARRGAEGRT